MPFRPGLPAAGSRGSSYTRRSPTSLCDTHRQHGKASGSFGFGPSFSLIDVILLGPAGGGGGAGSALAFFGFGCALFSCPSTGALRFL